MNDPTARYDPDANAISVRFRPEGSRYVESEEVAPGVVLDYDQAGHVIGIELLYVSDLPAGGKAKPHRAKPHEAAA